MCKNTVLLAYSIKASLFCDITFSLLIYLSLTSHTEVLIKFVDKTDFLILFTLLYWVDLLLNENKYKYAQNKSSASIKYAK